MDALADLSENLRSILRFELDRGNSILRVDRPAGTRCSLAVVFARPLDINGFKTQHGLPTGVSTWKNADSHYPLEAGFSCSSTRHAIAGPSN